MIGDQLQRVHFLPADCAVARTTAKAAGPSCDLIFYGDLNAVKTRIKSRTH